MKCTKAEAMDYLNTIALSGIPVNPQLVRNLCKAAEVPIPAHLDNKYQPLTVEEAKKLHDAFRRSVVNGL